MRWATSSTRPFGVRLNLFFVGDNARCEAFDSAFRVDIFDVAAGWR
jgi:hypothetical protein